MAEQRPCIDDWLEEAAREEGANQVGMYLIHNGIVRETPRAVVREGRENDDKVVGMFFDCDEDKVNAAVARAKEMPGVFYARAWCNRGELKLGDSIMVVLVGADIRPHAVDALVGLVGEIKTQCVTEVERLR